MLKPILMTHYTTNKYRNDIYDDQTFTEGSADNVNVYDFVYFDKSEYHFPSVYGIKIFNGDSLLKSAVIGSIGGGTAIHDTSAIIENDRLLICCSDTVFCLSIPDLTLLWRTQADQATCFQIFKQQEDFIVHGEFQVTELDKDGNKKWEFGGADIFVSIDNEEEFKIESDGISLTDFAKTKYKIDFDGKLLWVTHKRTEQASSISTLLKAGRTRFQKLFGN